MDGIGTVFQRLNMQYNDKVEMNFISIGTMQQLLYRIINGSIEAK